MNEYLRVVDTPETSDEYDPLGLSLQKLERHTSGLRLRKALKIFIEELAKEFGVKVVLLPVDELDMAPKHLVHSLQTYQSFLTHAQLVPVFTFTDRLPEELIVAHYDSDLVDTEKRRSSHVETERLTISEQLSVQFLARCFPVRNRIRLGPAPGRVQRAIFGRPSQQTGDGGEGRLAEPHELEVLELLTLSSFLLFGHPDKEDAHEVRAALRPSTLRRQLQVVDAMADCRLSHFRIPQSAKMTNPEIDPALLEEIATGSKPKKHVKTNDGDDAGDDKSLWENFDEAKAFRLRRLWGSRKPISRTINLDDEQHGRYLKSLVSSLASLNIGATWAIIFNAATWSLLNVHRDTLRELGLYLEDLYSWSPKELRSVVLDNILSRDRVVRHKLVDRWFNRTDYRRSQILSLLAANVFRPWMIGEEPYGDDEIAIRKQMEMEAGYSTSQMPPIDREWTSSTQEGKQDQFRKRMTIPAPQGLLWFLNVTLGFYLPQIMARNWADATSPDKSVREYMSGNGWDLCHAPINAMRIADARQELFSFGMVFLDPWGYRHALRAMTYENGTAEAESWRGESSGLGHLLLRIWSCHGYSRSRLWAAFSLWRGLGFIGQAVELAGRVWRHFEDPPEKNNQRYAQLETEFERLIRSHCLAGLVPGSLLSRGSNEDRLLRGFPRWEANEREDDIKELAQHLVKWLHNCWEDVILPLPAGDIWIGWSDCFVRRIHGECILGSLWPRIKGAYLEEHGRYQDKLDLAQRGAPGAERESSPHDSGDQRRGELGQQPSAAIVRPGDPWLDGG